MSQNRSILTPAALLAAAVTLTGCQSASTPTPIAAATAPAPAAQDVRSARWVHLPTGPQIAELYPAKAAQTKVSGFALVHCHVEETGDLTGCQPTVESPAGYGFAEATVGVAQYFKLAPGRYAADASLDIPFRWRLQ